MLQACRINGRALRYAADSLKDDVEVVHAAVRQAWQALQAEIRKPQLHSDFR